MLNDVIFINVPSAVERKGYLMKEKQAVLLVLHSHGDEVSLS